MLKPSNDSTLALSLQADLHSRQCGQRLGPQRRPGPHDHRPHRYQRPRAGRVSPLGRGLVCVSSLSLSVLQITLCSPQ